jgi:hypothetical protein
LKETPAAGRKTEAKNDPFEQVLIAGLNKSVEGIEKALAHAERTAALVQRGAGQDFDVNLVMHHRSSEQGNAVQFLKAMAEITLAAAKLRGEFNHNHNYDVTRRTAQQGGEGSTES